MQPKKAIGVHIFAGGFTRGVIQAGFDVVAQLETSMYGHETSRRNHPHVPVYQPQTAWAGVLAQAYGKVNFVYANPPCAPWSAAGMSKKENRGFAAQSYRKDPRVKCVEQVYDVITALRPEVAVWESVARLVSNGMSFLEEKAAYAASLGYQTTLVIADMADTGLPQHRKRVFVVTHRVAFLATAPTAEHVTVRQALAGVAFDPEFDLDPVSPLHVELLRDTPPGKKLFQTYNTKNNADYVPGTIAHGRPPFLYRRLAWDKPSYTVTGGPHLFHPDEERKLSVQEMAALCGYPRDYQFIGKRGDRYKQLAQCVTPPAGEWIARQALASIEQSLPITPDAKIDVYDWLNARPKAPAPDAAQLALV